MSNNIRIDETVYELLLESAQKTAETMSPEQIAELRTKCNYELGIIISETEKDFSKYSILVEKMKEPLDLDYVLNPVKKAKASFWLGQLINFIASFIIPREFLPTYGYPRGSVKAFEKQARAYDAKLNRLVNDAKKITEASAKSFKDIRRYFADDAGLIAFCNACENLSLAEQTVDVPDTFRRIASIFYLNNISFDVEVFRTSTKESNLTNRVDAAIEEIKRAYEKARGSNAVAEGIIRCYKNAKSLQELIWGLKTIVKTDEQQQTVSETEEQKQTILEPGVQQATETDAAALLRRAFMLLEDGDWKGADACCEKVLELEPKNAEAYLGKLMAELHVRTRDALKDQPKSFGNLSNYITAFCLGDETMMAELSGYNENARKNEIYRSGVQKMIVAVTESEYRSAAETFKTIPGFKDAHDRFLICQRKIQEIKAERERQVEEAQIAKEKAVQKRKRTIDTAALIFASIVVVCIAFVIVSAKVIIPNQKYKAAVELYTAGKYEEAIAAFAALDGYKDSAAQIETCKTAIKEENYTVAMELYNGGEYKEALAVFVALDGYMDSAAKTDEIEAKYLSDASVGSTVYFGSYEQDNDTSNGKEVIEWLVLAKAGNKVLVISKYALDRQVYNTSNTLVTWENCTLRTWLNDTFYNEAFDADHQKMIVSSTVTTHENPSYITSSGNKTSDKVFLLSVTEATMYFSSNEARKCAPTDYVIAQGTVTSNRDSTGGRATCSWWLRSPGTYLGYIANISFDGHVDKFGSPVAAGSVVRPALWIDLGS